MRVNRAVVEALADPAIVKQLSGQGLDMPPADQRTPEALGRLPQVRDREVVADPQGRRYQGEVTQEKNLMKFPRRTFLRLAAGAAALPAVRASPARSTRKPGRRAPSR